MHFVDAKGLLSAGNGMNLYRGCTHGCIYCDSRSLCYSFDHAFEDIEVKQNAPELLEKALRAKRKKCMIGTGAMCDPYMHCEERLELTRRCLEIIARHGFGLAIQTKSDRILRDANLLEEINRKARCVVQMTLTTLDDDLCRKIEPNVCPTSARFQALREFQQRGIPTVVWLTPILPWINDTRENIAGLLDGCIEVGVKGVLCMNMGLTLRDGNREYFYAALDRLFPGLRQRYQSTFGNAYECVSERNDELMALFHETCESHGLLHDPDRVFAYLKEFPEPYEQVSLFEDI